LQRAAHVANTVYVVHLPYVADDAAQAEAERQALERHPAPSATKLTLYLIDYSCA
jgi:hypothetical protein